MSGTEHHDSLPARVTVLERDVATIGRNLDKFISTATDQFSRIAQGIQDLDRSKAPSMDWKGMLLLCIPAVTGGWFVIQMSMQPLTTQGVNRDQRISNLESVVYKVNQTRFTLHDGEQLQEMLELKMQLSEAQLRAEMKETVK